MTNARYTMTPEEQEAWEREMAEAESAVTYSDQLGAWLAQGGPP